VSPHNVRELLVVVVTLVVMMVGITYVDGLARVVVVILIVSIGVGGDVTGSVQRVREMEREIKAETQEAPPLQDVEWGGLRAIRI
jgi:hypothetical protein